MPAESELSRRIRSALAEFVKRDAGSIRAEHTLRGDLGLDSMARIELLYNLEDVFDLQIPDQDLARFATVADVIAYVDARLTPAPGVAGPRQVRKKKAG
ncbi:MAG: acyl carrier protein [Gammaproteobacteria bacterium]